MDTVRVVTSLEEGKDNGTLDKYTAYIDLSNACRQFYQARVAEAECIKNRWQKQCRPCNDNDRPARGDHNSNTSTTTTTTTTGRRHKNSIDAAMEKLRTEMTSLMDQDLSLMKQLLTLNETIEDLKWQRRCSLSQSSVTSSADFAHSTSSMSDSDMDDSDLDLAHPHPHYLHPHPHYLHPHPHHRNTTTASSSTSTATTTCLSSRIVFSSPQSSSATPSSSSSSSKARRSQGSSAHVSSSTHAQVRVSEKVYHSEQDSLDSGIHETGSSGEEEAAV